MATKLTYKERGFVKDVVLGKSGTEAALNNYDIQGKDPDNVAAVIAHENLRKPKIADAISKAIKEDDIEQAFRKLLNLKRLDYFVFSKALSDDEITEHVQAQGIEVLNIRPTEKGKMAFFAIPDGQAIAKALDFAAKIEGAYAPDKHAHLNVSMDLSTDPTAIDLDKLVEEAESKLKEQKLNG